MDYPPLLSRGILHSAKPGWRPILVLKCELRKQRYVTGGQLAKLIHRDRIGKQGKLSISCCAVIFDPSRQKVLLTRRADNGRWCVPGGGMDPGESASETCVREVLEETGLITEIKRLVGVYTSPHYLFEYADGNRIQPISMFFEVTSIGGELIITEETTEVGYFNRAEMKSMNIMEDQHERIDHAFEGVEAAYIR